jgi:hypothetical protein
MNTPQPSPVPGTTPQADPRSGANPGYDDANPRVQADVPRHQPDARGADFGKVPDPEAGGLNRPPGTSPDPASDSP